MCVSSRLSTCGTEIAHALPSPAAFGQATTFHDVSTLPSGLLACQWPSIAASTVGWSSSTVSPMESPSQICSGAITSSAMIEAFIAR